MKSLMLLSLTLLLAACSSTSTTTNSNLNADETLSLEQIAEKSQSTDSILNNEELYVPAYLNNSARNTTKDISGSKVSTKTNKKTTTR